MFRWLTAGESHGKTLLAVIDGFPAGLKIDTAPIDRELARRQGGYGRGGRQKLEIDTVEVEPSRPGLVRIDGGSHSAYYPEHKQGLDEPMGLIRRGGRFRTGRRCATSTKSAMPGW